MLRALHISLAFLLLTASAGLPLVQHLCMGRVMSTGLFAPADCCGPKDACAAAGAKAPNCCDDEVAFLDVIQDAEWNAQALPALPAAVVRPPVPKNFLPVEAPLLSRKVLLFGHYHPPPRPAPPARSGYQVYRL